MKRVVFNLKSYLKTGRANRSKSREIIAQGDYDMKLPFYKNTKVCLAIIL